MKISNQLFSKTVLNQDDIKGNSFEECTFKDVIITGDILSKAKRCVFVRCLFPNKQNWSVMGSECGFKNCHFTVVEFEKTSSHLAFGFEGGRINRIEILYREGITSAFSFLNKKKVEVGELVFKILAPDPQQYRLASRFLKTLNLKNDTKKSVEQVI